MQGRYGADQFSRFLLGACLVLLLLNMFTGLPLIYLMALALLVYSYFRMFSRNIYKRSEENRKYMEKTDGIRRSFDRMRRRAAQSKDYHIYKCPSCGQKIRIPRGKGKIEITCPNCRNKFQKRG